MMTPDMEARLLHALMVNVWRLNNYENRMVMQATDLKVGDLVMEFTSLFSRRNDPFRIGVVKSVPFPDDPSGAVYLELLDGTEQAWENAAFIRICEQFKWEEK